MLRRTAVVAAVSAMHFEGTRVGNKYDVDNKEKKR